MKKRLWSLLLCLVLMFSVTACGDKDAVSDKGNDKKKDDDKVAVKDLKPEEMVSGQFEYFSKQLTETLEQIPATESSSQKQGMDIKLNFKPGSQIVESYELTGLESVGLNMGLDIKDLLEMRLTGNLLLNGNKIVNMDMVLDKDKAVVRVPEFSDTAFGMELENGMESVLGNNLTQATEGMPTAADFLSIWKKYSEDFINCFKYKETVEKATIGTGDYAIEADKYVNVAKMEDLKNVLEALMKELEKYPALGVTAEEIDTDVEEVIFSYYSNKDDEFAWEIETQEDDEKNCVVLLSSKKGFRLCHIVDGEEEDVLLYSVKESDKKGKIVLVNDGEELVIQYDNFSENHVDLSAEIEGVSLELGIDSKEGDAKITFSVKSDEIEADGKFTADDKNGKLELNITYQGIQLGSATLEFTSRDFNSYSVPDSYVDPEEWAQTVDQTKVLELLQKLMMDYPFIEKLLNGIM